jgi:prophage tail gpP-like protein
MPKPEETAIITVNGAEYREWESVTVHLEFPGIFRTFRFSVSEQSPGALTMSKLQLKPGDQAQVHLGGELAITGYIYERQTVLDAGRHAVLLVGQSLPGDTTRTSIDHTKLGEKGQFRDKSLVQIATELLKPYGIKVVTKGDSSKMNIPFEDAQVMPGESPFHMIERLARRSAAFIGDDNAGNFVLYGGESGGAQAGSGAALIEGENIQSERVVITDMELINPGIAMGQAWGTDQKWGRDVAQQELRQKGSATRYKPYLFLMERSLGPQRLQQELKMRLDYEMAWRDVTKISAEIDVYGWHKPGGGLWQAAPDELVYVNSPSAMVSENLAVQAITFTQTNEGGTMTKLTCVNPAFYFGAGVQF